MAIGIRYVYFVRPVGLPGPVKIGCSRVPEERLKYLSTWSPFPLEIAVTIPGDQTLEANIHDCLARSYSHLEWFHPTKEVMKLVDDLIAGTPLEEAIDLSVRFGCVRSIKRPNGGRWTDMARMKRSETARYYRMHMAAE
jgi:hypothetical protein